jgi:hypothetical protein
MESTRRLAIAATVGAAVIGLAAASDFLASSFWSSHAMLTALIASLLVLAVTVVVLNEVLERRDRKRWSVLAQYVLFQLVQSARATWIGLVELVAEHEVETGSTEGLGNDWLHDQIVATTQLAVRLDYESRALGFRLLPLAWWAERTRAFVGELPPLSG